MTKPPTLKWDYKMISIGNATTTPRFEELSREGWGVVSEAYGRVLLKRLRFDFVPVDPDQADVP